MPPRRQRFFKGQKPNQQRSRRQAEQEQKVLTFDDWYDSTLIEARRILPQPGGGQKYTAAQFEIALFGFRDFDHLESILEQPVDFTDHYDSKIEYNVGFDWLDLAVHYEDQDAIDYFQTRLKEKRFAEAYDRYKDKIRPNCAMEKWADPSSDEESPTKRKRVR